MLKKCYGLVLGLMVLAGSACVTPTHASSASVLIANIRAGSQAGAAEEGVVLYNNSSFEADVTNWCLTNKAAVKFVCFTPRSQHKKSIIPAYSYATIVSTKVAGSNDPSLYSSIYEAASGSSGSIVASADTISLIDADSQLVDQFAWSSTVVSTQQWARIKLSILPDLFMDTNASGDWQKVVFNEFPVSQMEYREITPEGPIEEPQDGEESEEGEGPAGGSPVGQSGGPFADLPIQITELLPNAAGSDEGNEFIELYNPNPQGEVSLANYKLKVGPFLERSIALPNYILKAGEYKAFTNSELSYSLLNSSSRVSLFTKEGVLVSEAPAYTAPAEGKSWALIGDTWQYTGRPTPGAANQADLVGLGVEGGGGVGAPAANGSAVTLKPCASNQYRSPETNRCRLLVTASAASAGPSVCKEGQERNFATNRCRNIVASTIATACKKGQERNPETNRCRNIKKLATAGFGVKGAVTRQQSGMGWYMWATIAGVVLLIVGYAVWEWREELKRLFKIVRSKFAGRAR